MTNIKRTYLSILLAATLILGNISTAFAAVPMVHNLLPNATIVDGDTHVGVFDSKSLPAGDERREFLTEWLEIMAQDGTPNNGYMYLLFYRNYTAEGNFFEYLWFVKVPETAKYFVSTLNSNIGFTFSEKFTFLNYSITSNSFVAKLGTASSVGSSTRLICGSHIDYFADDSNYYGTVSSHSKLNLDKHGADWQGRLILNFNDDINDIVPTPDPDPEPLPPYVPPELPDIPVGDGKYVVYDTSAWKGFLNYVIGNIGSAVKVGLLILGIISGILLVIKVVKMFTRSA